MADKEEVFRGPVWRNERNCTPWDNTHHTEHRVFESHKLSASAARHTHTTTQSRQNYSVLSKFDWLNECVFQTALHIKYLRSENVTTNLISTQLCLHRRAGQEKNKQFNFPVAFLEALGILHLVSPKPAKRKKLQGY